MILSALKLGGSDSVQLLVLIGALTFVPALLFTVTAHPHPGRPGLHPLGPGHADRAAQSGAGRHLAVPHVLRDGPTFQQINKVAIQPLTHHTISQSVASRGQERCATSCPPDAHQGPGAVREARRRQAPPHAGRRPTYVLIPAFIISELKTAFQIASSYSCRSLVIDLVVSSTLMSMGHG